MAKRKYLERVVALPEQKTVQAVYVTEYTDGAGKNKRVVGREKEVVTIDPDNKPKVKDQLVADIAKLVL